MTVIDMPSIAPTPGGLTGTQSAPVATSTRTSCPYCALQCGLFLERSIVDSDEPLIVVPDPGASANRGTLCVKGWTSTALLNHPDRLLQPLVRGASGELEPATWEQAMDRITTGIQSVQSRYGLASTAVFGSGALTNEKGYLLGKFARIGLQTPNIDYNGRFCMSSAAAASQRALGIDRGLPFPLADIQGAEVILMAGANVAETMPPMMQHFTAQKRNGGRLIVVDPRRTNTAKLGFMHLPIKPGTDAALANGLLHILIRDNLVDESFIAARTEGFEAIRALAASYFPERVERITGIKQSALLRVAQMLGFAKSVMVLTARGPEQQSHGVDNSSAYINLALALGAPGKANSGYGSITGQGNGQGGREHGQKTDQLPGYRSINDPQARQHIAEIWGVGETEIPGPRKPAYELLETLGTDEGARAMLVFGSNPVVSAPNANLVTERIKALDLLVVSDFFVSETAELADVVLPAAQWAEEDGTVTNLEGRVILRPIATPPPEGVRTDLQIMCEIADRLGRGRYFRYDNPEQVFEELRRASEGGKADYRGITYDRLIAEQGVYWPCPDESHPGTPRLFTESFPTESGRATFQPVAHWTPAEEPDEAYPLYLTTGRVLAQYQSGTQTRRVEKLNRMAPTPKVEIHPDTANKYGISDAHEVILVSRRGSVRMTAKVTKAIRKDTVFAPFHWGGDQAINALTNPEQDPISGMPEFKACAVKIVRNYAGRIESGRSQ